MDVRGLIGEQEHGDGRDGDEREGHPRLDDGDGERALWVSVDPDAWDNGRHAPTLQSNSMSQMLLRTHAALCTSVLPTANSAICTASTLWLVPCAYAAIVRPHAVPTNSVVSTGQGIGARR